MSVYAPIVRIALRYGVGFVVGTEVGEMLAGDPDVVLLVALGIGAGVETIYALAKHHGWTT